jgi:hypothetical protein
MRSLDSIATPPILIALSFAILKFAAIEAPGHPVMADDRQS